MLNSRMVYVIFFGIFVYLNNANTQMLKIGFLLSLPVCTFFLFFFISVLLNKHNK